MCRKYVFPSGRFGVLTIVLGKVGAERGKMQKVRKKEERLPKSKNLNGFET